MNELVVARVWMAGVFIMMLVFGIISFIGYLKQKRMKDELPSLQDNKSKEKTDTPLS